MASALFGGLSEAVSATTPAIAPMIAMTLVSNERNRQLTVARGLNHAQATSTMSHAAASGQTSQQMERAQQFRQHQRRRAQQDCPAQDRIAQNSVYWLLSRHVLLLTGEEIEHGGEGGAATLTWLPPGTST